MFKRYHITLGAPTTAGGKVTTASAATAVDGVPIALVDDKVFCPACMGEGVIRAAGPRLPERWDGREVALDGDLCVCGCHPSPRLLNAQSRKSQVVD